jgi:hypothetical protein
LFLTIRSAFILSNIAGLRAIGEIDCGEANHEKTEENFFHWNTPSSRIEFREKERLRCAIGLCGCLLWGTTALLHEPATKPESGFPSSRLLMYSYLLQTILRIIAPMIAAVQTTSKASRRKPDLVVLLLLLVLCEMNHSVFALTRQNHPTARQAIIDPYGAMLDSNPILQPPTVRQKKSLQEEAAEIEKDFGVKVIQEEDGLYCEINSAEYHNYQYDFRVSLPQGLQTLTSVPPHPQHGFFVRLASKPQARITVTGEFNSALYESLDEVVAVEVNAAKQLTANFEITARTATKLQDIPAVLLVAQFTNENSDETMISEQLVALRREAEDDFGIIYVFRLDTPKSRYKADRKVFQMIINSCRRYSETTEPIR